MDEILTIGDVAKRAGVKASALRFYEAEGLITALRSQGGRRLFAKETLRRVAFIRVAQQVGLSLEEIRTALKGLPRERTPTKADWAAISGGWQKMLDTRIRLMTALRDQLTSCIGCGCLSLKACQLYNPADQAGFRGPGPRYLLGDRPPAGAQRTAKPPRPVKS